jgi:hypothetical protein
MGYPKEQIALYWRERRCRKAWAGHVRACRQAAIVAAGNCPLKAKAAVLGSGHLFDLPLAELAELFAEVVLVDILHPAACRRRAKAFSNVSVVEEDLTGIAAALYRHVSRAAPGPLPVPPQAGQTAASSWRDADFTLSMNVLSQLPVLPAAHAEKSGLFDDRAIADFRQSIIRQHLAMLAGLAGRVCLISETGREITGGETTVLEEPLEGVGPAAAEWRETAAWVWDIAPRGELYRDRDVRLTMRAFNRIF